VRHFHSKSESYRKHIGYNESKPGPWDAGFFYFDVTIMKLIRVLVVFTLSCCALPRLVLGAISLDTAQQCLDFKLKILKNRKRIVAAVVVPDQTKLIMFGEAKLNDIYEIASLTKTFTANLLAQEVVAKNLKLSDSIPNEYQKDSAHPITYQHLTTHTSGIIGREHGANNFPEYHNPNLQSPYEGLTIQIFKTLYATTPFVAVPGQQWDCSDLGEGLLGFVLAERNHSTYEELVTQNIFNQLGMKDSFFEVPKNDLRRFPQGNVNGSTWSHWNLFNTAISPAGAIRSTISDMAIYARANLLPTGNLAAAIKLAQQPLFYIESYRKWIGMNWIVEPDKQLVWHNGSSIAFNSILAVSFKRNLAIVVMTDTGIFVTDENGHTTQDTSIDQIVFGCLD
jgi:CubicO group peptidase (beta-lactamase class C family)